MTSPTLFLDFDGVLHPEYCSPSSHFEHAQRLADCLAFHPNVDVVISSTWRERYTLGELRARLPQLLQDRIVGITSLAAGSDNIPDRLLGYSRHAECWLWQRDNKVASDAWVALDDRPWLFYPFTRHLIECKSSVGLTDENILALDCELTKITWS